MTMETADGRPVASGRSESVPRDMLVGAAILAFCAVAYWITLGFKEAPAALAQNVQPATFPQLVIGVIVALTIGMMALGLRSAGGWREMPPPPVYATAAMMIGFVIAFDTLGILAAMALFCFAGPLVWGARNLAAVAVFAVAFPALVYLVFAVGLGVYFAPGIVQNAIAAIS